MKNIAGSAFILSLLLFLYWALGQGKNDSPPFFVVGTTAQESPGSVLFIALTGAVLAPMMTYLVSCCADGFRIFILPACLGGGVACALAAAAIGYRVQYRGELLEPYSGVFLSGGELAYFSVAGGFVGILVFYSMKRLFPPGSRFAIVESFSTFLLGSILMGIGVLCFTAIEVADKLGGVIGVVLGIAGLGGYLLLTSC